MPNNDTPDRMNPYQSPTSATVEPSRTQIDWAGPLLTLSVCSFLVSIACSAETVIDSDRWIVDGMASTFFVIAVTSLILAFRCQGRSRLRRQRQDQTTIN